MYFTFKLQLSDILNTIEFPPLSFFLLPPFVLHSIFCYQFTVNILLQRKIRNYAKGFYFKNQKNQPYPFFSNFLDLIHFLGVFFGTATGLFSVFCSFPSFPRHPGWERDLGMTDSTFSCDSAGADELTERWKAGLFPAD